MEYDKTIVNLENINFWNSLYNLKIENNENICPECNEIMNEKINICNNCQNYVDLYSHCKKEYIKCCACEKIKTYNYIGSYCDNFLHICCSCEDLYKKFYKNIMKYINDKVKYADKIIDKFPSYLCEYKYSDHYDDLYYISEIEEFMLFVKNQKYNDNEEMINSNQLSKVINTMKKYLK